MFYLIIINLFHSLRAYLSGCFKMFLKEVEKIFLENRDFIIHELLTRYGPLSNYKILGEFENYIIECLTETESFIIRLVHSSHRLTNLITAELDWMLYLSKNAKSFSIPKLRLSNAGKEIEVIQLENSYFTVVGFEKAKGNHITKEIWDKNLFERWGQSVGELHKLTKRYKGNNEFKRPDWNELTSFEDINDILPENQKKIKLKYFDMINSFSKLPKNVDSYGLIHNDFHIWNFFINNGSIILFDFDDCCYDWFISDVAVILFHAVQYSTNNLEIDSFAKDFLHYFFKGY